MYEGVSDVAIHFAFPSGVLTYDCPSCDQRCCKTGGLPLFPREKERIVATYPALELVAPQGAEQIGVFATPCSGCWFLAERRCTLTTAHGGALRPYACTLYPWNLFGAHGETLVVAPHPLCPLSVEPGGGTTHAFVLDLLQKLGAAGAPPSPVRSTDPPGALALERVIRDACTAAITDGLGPLELLAFSDLATRSFSKGQLGDLDLTHLDATTAEAGDRMGAMADVVGVQLPSAAVLAELAPTIAAWTPSLRLFALEHVSLSRLPDAMTALLLYAAHWQSERPGRRLLPQTLTQMLGSLGETIAVLASWDEPWTGETVETLGLRPGATPSAVVRPRLAKDPLERARQLRLVARARGHA
jgi:hypothetical protein